MSKRAIFTSVLALPLLAGAFLAAQTPATIGGEKIVLLTRKPVSKTNPEFTSVTVLPGRGMEILAITANFPGKGEIPVLATTGLATAADILDHQDNEVGAKGYSMGAAFLVPYPNRIRGPLSADGKTLTTTWQSHTLTLPADNIGKLPGAERHALHGLILKSQAQDVRVAGIPGGQQVTGIIHAADFGGHWLSKTDLAFTIKLTAEALDVSVAASNVGSEAEPIGIAWHPYFNLPSGDRTQARVTIPGSVVAAVDNYDNVFPTGKLLSVVDTPFDFQAGRTLANGFYDDNFTHLDWKNGTVTAQIVDPAANYGIDIQGLSPAIKTIQLYAPPDKPFVALEHQYNFADPFGKEWGSTNTAMVTLQPGESTKWQVRLHVFVP